MERFDLALAWNSEEDGDFVGILEKLCRTRNLALLQITSENFEPIQNELKNSQIGFNTFFDRGSDNDPRFLFLYRWAYDHNVFVINKPELVSRAIDKAKMHLDLINTGLQTPYTIFLPSYKDQPEVQPIDLTPLKDKFIIKPAHGGGGEGVITEATSWSKVLEARQEFPDDMYLLQVFITASQFDSRQAWFRIIFCTGELYPCWWSTHTHTYTLVQSREEQAYNLSPLRKITQTIAGVCKLDLFSTEIALTSEGNFVVVDYVNDQIDLRLQSKSADGIPDEIVEKIAQNIATLVANKSPDS
jgi:hypothetical protein